MLPHARSRSTARRRASGEASRRAAVKTQSLNASSVDDPRFRSNYTVIPRPDLPITAPENAGFYDLLQRLAAYPSAGGFAFDPGACSGDPIGDPNSCLDNIKIIQDAALTNLGLDHDVAGLLELCNQALAGQSTGGATLGAITEAADVINRGFDECRIIVPCPEPCPPPPDPVVTR